MKPNILHSVRARTLELPSSWSKRNLRNNNWSCWNINCRWFQVGRAKRGWISWVLSKNSKVGGEDMNYTAQVFLPVPAACAGNNICKTYSKHSNVCDNSVKYLQCFLQTSAVLPCFPEQQGTWTTLWRKQFKSGLSQKILTWWFHIQSCVIFCDQRVSKSSESVCTWLCPLAHTG